MAKKVYVGVDGKARNVKKIYIGVDEKARKVKKGYIGVGGIARPFFSGEPDLKLEYYGEVAPLEDARAYGSSGNVGEFALYGGGLSNKNWPDGAPYLESLVVNTVEAYNNSLTRLSVPNLSVPSDVDMCDYMGYNVVDYGFIGQAATRNSNYLFYVGGIPFMIAGDEDGYLWPFRHHEGNDVASVYNSDLVKTEIVDNFYHPVDVMFSVGTDKYAVFAGGGIWHDDVFYEVVFAYDNNLVKSIADDLQLGRWYSDAGPSCYSATSTNGSVIIAGGIGMGEDSFYSTVPLVDAYEENLVHHCLADLDEARFGVAYGVIGSKTLIIGGYVYSSSAHRTSNVVDCYDEHFVKIPVSPLDFDEVEMEYTLLSKPINIKLGESVGAVYGDTVYLYNENLVRTSFQLEVENEFTGAMSIGNTMLLTGFVESNDNTDPGNIFPNVHAFTLI